MIALNFMVLVYLTSKETWLTRESGIFGFLRLALAVELYLSHLSLSLSDCQLHLASQEQKRNKMLYTWELLVFCSTNACLNGTSRCCAVAEHYISDFCPAFLPWERVQKRTQLEHPGLSHPSRLLLRGHQSHSTIVAQKRYLNPTKICQYSS